MLFFELVVMYFTLLTFIDPSQGQNCTGNQGTNTTERVRRLRTLMRDNGVKAYIIPTDDEHQNEYVSSYDQRRVFISGFAGSAGLAIVTDTKQALWTDGRYFLQAEKELDCNWELMRQGEQGVQSSTEWLKTNLNQNDSVGSDPRFLSAGSWNSYTNSLWPAGINMKPTPDLVGQVWDETGARPAATNYPLLVLNMTFAGKSWEDKVADIRTKLSAANVGAVIISALDEVAWLFNLRGTDISYNPMFFAYAIIENGTHPRLFLRNHTERLPTIYRHLSCTTYGTCTANQSCVEVTNYEAVSDHVKALNARRVRVWMSYQINYALYSLINESSLVYNQPSPARLMKAIKNEKEKQGMINSHLRDSAAIIQFVARLEEELNRGEKWNELKVCKELEQVRRKKMYNQGLSFPTIAGSGENGAIIHYSPSNETNKDVTKEYMFLLDSGGQYLDGTTDITRTFHFGTPSEFQKFTYTLVLSGVIDLLTAVFPANATLGSSLDTLARNSLWQNGLNYQHGTGHGIGMFLNVHEGPAGIGNRRQSYDVSYENAIYEGMFFSDEPGYYDKDKEFGIRLETIMMARFKSTKYGTENTYLGFDPVAYVPFERKLIDTSMLSAKQMTWLNQYHNDCLAKVRAELYDDTRAHDWLVERTKPIIPEQTSAAMSISAQVSLVLIPVASLMLVALDY